MRKFYFLITMLLVVATAWSQNKVWDGPATGGSWATPANWSGNVVPSTTDIVEFGTGISGTITNVPGQTIGGLIVTDGANITLSKPTAGGANTLTIANGTGTDFTIAASSVLILGNEIDITLANGSSLANSTTANIAGTFDLNDRTYNTNNTNSNTTIANGGVIEANANGDVTCTNPARLIIQSGGTYLHARDGGTIPDATWDDNAICSITGVTTSVPAGLDQDFGNFTWNAPSQTASLSFAGALANIDGNFTVASTGSGSIRLKTSGGGTTNTLVGGDYIQTGGTLYIVFTSDVHNLNILGDFNMSGGTLARNGGTTNVNFNGTTEQLFTKTGGTISGAVNFAISGGAIVNFGTSVLNGSIGTFTLNSTGKIITAHANGLGATGSIQVTGTKTFNSGADYEFRGASTGTFTTSTNPQVRNFTVNNTSANVTLAQPMTVNGALTLTDGELLSDATNLLTIADNGTSSAGSNTSFVNGPIRKAGNDVFTFPVGRTGTGYVPISMTAPAATNTVMTAEYLRGVPPNNTTITAPGITHISACDYWRFDHTSGTLPTIDVTANWNANNPCNGVNYVTNPGTIKLVHHNGSAWNTSSPANGAGSPGAGTVTWTALNTFSFFALGTTATGNENPLPVLFDNVKAYDKNSGVQIEWSNLTERDIVNYTVERSVNGRDYSALKVVLPTSNQNDKASYAEFDPSPVQGANFYRIKVQESFGKIIYSKVLRVETGRVRTGFSVYPNPLVGSQFTLALTGVKQGQYNIRIVNSNGQNVFQKSLTAQSSGLTQTLEMPAAVKPGVYSIVITGEGYLESKLFVVQ